MYKPLFSLLLAVLVEAISAVAACLKAHIMRHLHPNGHDAFDDCQAFA